MKNKLFIVLFIFSFICNVYGLEEEITYDCEVLIDGEEYSSILDNKYTTYINANSKEMITINCQEPITHLYIYYDKKSTTGTVNEKTKIGQNGYLHELIELNGKDKSITIKYDDDYAIADIHLFNTKKLPDWVEDWESLEKSDLMLFSTHADDEQLFFAGLMPTYVDQGKKIQVIYFTNHFNNPSRYHELLEGLWTIGVKYYPVISDFPDEYCESIEDAIASLNNAGFNTDDALAYQVTQIRKYKPSVIVGHDENGEYGHGQHILNTDILKEAILKANDKDYDKASLDKYGLWETKKLYLHLYDKNKIILNYDIPLEEFDGKTAYEVSKLGFAKHRSQQFTWFTAWLNGEDNEFTSATQIEEYNPAYYGLYYSSVGDDIKKDDMFENIKESPIEIVKKTKKAIKKITKKVNSNTKLKYTGITLISISILGFIGVILNKHK